MNMKRTLLSLSASFMAVCGHSTASHAQTTAAPNAAHDVAQQTQTLANGTLGIQLPVQMNWDEIIKSGVKIKSDTINTDLKTCALVRVVETEQKKGLLTKTVISNRYDLFVRTDDGQDVKFDQTCLHNKATAENAARQLKLDRRKDEMAFEISMKTLHTTMNPKSRFDAAVIATGMLETQDDVRIASFQNMMAKYKLTPETLKKAVVAYEADQKRASLTNGESSCQLVERNNKKTLVCDVR